MEPRIEFAAAADGTRIAWTAVLRRGLEGLAGRVRLIQYDGRGTGRSQRDVTDLSLDAHLRDLDAVLDAAGVRDVVLLGFYHSVITAIAWAARHPDRARGLVLFGGAARGWDPMREAGTQALLSLIERDWDTFVESAVHAWLGWPDDAEGRAAADWFRTSTSPAVARATLQASAEMDVTAEAATVRAPALVLHRRDGQVIPLEVSQALADLLPNGRLEILPGASASLFFERTDEIIDRLTAFALDPSGLAPSSPTAAPSPAAPAAGRRATARRSSSTDGGATELSAREREVLRLIAAGESNGEIAATLGLSINTVERHVSNLYRKIDARGRADATAWAIRRGFA